MGRFVNPFTDTGFKIIFGQELSKPLLIDFLNSLFDGKEIIIDISFLDKEKPRITKESRGIIYDIFCRTNDNRNIIVEMQNKGQEFFIERSIYYVSEAISRQSKRGEWNYNFDAVYFVAFMNFALDTLTEFRTDVELCNTKTKKSITNKIKFIYLQLPYYTKSEEECRTNFERWIYIFKNMEILDRMPWAAKSAVFQELSKIAEIANMTKSQRSKYDADLKIFRDTTNAIDYAHKKGITEGKNEMVIEMLKNGYPIDVIANISKLPTDEIERLRSSLNNDSIHR